MTRSIGMPGRGRNSHFYAVGAGEGGGDFLGFCQYTVDRASLQGWDGANWAFTERKHGVCVLVYGCSGASVVDTMGCCLGLIAFRSPPL